MANLETLQLTINANAESASQGLNSLINSLTSLSKKIGKSVSGLRQLNEELSKLKRTGTIKMPNLSNATGTSKAVSAAQKQAQAIEEWRKNRKPLTFSHFRDNVWTEEQERAANPQWFNNYDSPEWQAKAEANSALREKNEQIEKSFNETATSAEQLSGSLKNVAQAAEIPVSKLDALKMKLEGLDQAMDKAASKGDTLGVANKRLAMFSTADKIEKETAALSGQAKEAGFLATALEKAKGTLSGFGKSFSRIGRIASTMLIRTALRSLMKAFSESWSAAYQFSKHMGGQFAESVDKAKTLLAGVTTSIISTFSPAISALLPVIQSVVGAIQYLCKAIQWLFSLLGMSNELFGASTDAINAYSGASGGAGKANKEMLASFDELNVISQESGGGGGGGGGASYKNGLFSDVISDEMAKVQLIVSESLLALGLILACTGHFGIGLGLMAIGAAGIAKTVIADWGSLSKEMQGELATIMTIVGAASLALGAILAFSGANIPLGIGLMAIGAANLAAVAYVNFTNGLPDEVKKTITTILGIVGGALLAVGAVLAFSGANIPLGIGLMIAGGLSLAGAVALNWDSLSRKVKQVFEGLCWAIENAWENVKTAVNNAWEAVKKWWEDSGIGTNVRKIWGGVSSFFRGLWDNISEWAGAAWSGISKWWHTNVTTNLEKGGIWGGVSGFFSGLWQTISDSATAAWNVVKDWWEKTGIGQWVRGAWDDVGNFLTNSIWNPIKNAAKSAWNTVKDWWEKTGVGQWVRGAWNDVGNFLTNSIWNPIKNAASKAWDTVRKWWEDSGIGRAVRGVWDEVGNFLTNTIWNPIKNTVNNAWTAVKDWWNSNIYTYISRAWERVSQVFEPIKKVVDQIVEGIKFITGGQHTVEIVEKVITPGTPENNATKAATNLVNTAASTGNVFQKAFGAVSNFVSGIFGLKAAGDYDIPRGEVFIAQEAGAELIGSINGKTSVANQQQIIDGIASGVERANNEQNALLRQQNELLRGILEKEASVKIGASAMLGREVKRSLDMYNTVAG